MSQQTSTSCQSAEDERDDDLFHSVTMAEQSAWSKGFTEGQVEGKKRYYQDGFRMGADKGVELGTEIGFYTGYASHILKENQGNESKIRVIKVCESIIQTSDRCKNLGPMDESLTENLSKLQAKFKQLTSLLGRQVEYKNVVGSTTGVSF